MQRVSIELESVLAKSAEACRKNQEKQQIRIKVT
jgi:hypothetical protein